MLERCSTHHAASSSYRVTAFLLHVARPVAAQNAVQAHGSVWSLHPARTAANSGRAATVARALIPAQTLDPRKLTVTYTSPSAAELERLTVPERSPRRYTLTHNDLTAQLYLSIGEDFDASAISGWYTRLVRDDVRAEWCFEGGPALHVHCHVSGQAFPLSPSRYRSFVFRREMPLVLDSIAFAERAVIAREGLFDAPMFIHFEASEADLARVEYWGTLGEWIDRAESTANYLGRVSRTLEGAVPVNSGTTRLEGPLDTFLEKLAEALLDDVRPGEALEVVRAVARNGPDTSATSVEEATCSSHSANGSSKGTAAAARSNGNGAAGSGGSGSVLETQQAVAKAHADPQADGSAAQRHRSSSFSDSLGFECSDSDSDTNGTGTVGTGAAAPRTEAPPPRRFEAPEAERTAGRGLAGVGSGVARSGVDEASWPSRALHTYPCAGARVPGAVMPNLSGRRRATGAAAGWCRSRPSSRLRAGSALCGLQQPQPPQ